MTLSAHEFVEALNQQLEPGQKKILLSDDQAKVVEAAAVPTLVVAGAGSGKTEVMSLRALYLMYREGYTPDSILGLTFTRKATANFAERIQHQLRLMRKAGLVDPDPLAEWGATVSTYNSFAAEVVREHGLLIGVQPRTKLITDAASWQIVDALLASYTGELPDYQPSTMREAILGLSSDLTDHQVSPALAQEQWNRIADQVEDPIPGVNPTTGRKRTAYGNDMKKLGPKFRARAQLLPLVQQYREYKRENNMMDFTDQLALARKILQSHPQVAADIRSQYRAILLDEFQDTSVGQLELFAELFHDTAVTAVGDPNQAIYGWRGASAASLAMFLPNFDLSKRGGVLQLSDAWRNWPGILEAANVVALPDSVETAQRQQAYGPKAVDTALQSIQIDKLRANPGHPGRGQVKYLFPSTEEDEFDLVARQIWNWRNAVKPGEKMPTIAILSRKSRNFVPLDKALRKYGISPYIVGLGGLVTQPAVADIRSVMRALVDPDHGASVMRLVTNLDLSPDDIVVLWDWARELGKKRVFNEDAADPTASSSEMNVQADAVGQDAKTQANAQPADTQLAEPESAEVSQDGATKSGGDLRVEFLLDAVMNPPAIGWRRRGKHGFSAEARSRVLQLARRLNRVREHFDLSIPQVISRVVTTFDLDLDIQSDPLENQGEVAIDAFIEMAANYESETPFASIKNFLDWVDKTLEADERIEIPAGEVADSTVKILTIHQAKGLEWDKVVVVGLTEQDFPGSDLRSNNVGDEWTLHSPLPEIRPTAGWTSELDQIPYDLRSDRTLNGQEILPELGNMIGLDVVESDAILAEYKAKLALHELREARRLAYVAWTRASDELLLTGSWYRVERRRIPSRFLLQMVQGESGDIAGAPLAVPVQLGDVKVDGHPDPATPVVEALADAVPGEESIDEELSFPKAPAYSRIKMTQSAGQVTGEIERIRAAVTSGASSEQILEGALDELYASLGNADPFELAGYRQMLDHVKDAIAREKAPAENQVIIELGHLSATSVGKFLQSPDRLAQETRRPLPAEPSDAARLGTVFHRWAETWCRQAATFDPLTEPETQVPVVELGEASDPADVQALSLSQKKRFEQMQSRAQAIFGERPENVYSIEQPFSYATDGLTIRGRYDAIFKDGEKYRIVDWKTGVPHAKHQSDFLSDYAVQLEIYRRAFAQAKDLGHEDIEAELVFLGGDDCPLEDRRVTLAQLHKIIGDRDFEQAWREAIESLQ